MEINVAFQDRSELWVCFLQEAEGAVMRSRRGRLWSGLWHGMTLQEKSQPAKWVHTGLVFKRYCVFQTVCWGAVSFLFVEFESITSAEWLAEGFVPKNCSPSRASGAPGVFGAWCRGCVTPEWALELNWRGSLYHWEPFGAPCAFQQQGRLMTGTPRNNFWLSLSSPGRNPLILFREAFQPYAYLEFLL